MATKIVSFGFRRMSLKHNMSTVKNVGLKNILLFCYFGNCFNVEESILLFMISSTQIGRPNK